nr:uncharacterized protein LOC111423988 [Onthophagus taurus]
MIRKQGYHDSSSQKPYHISIKDYSDVVSERIEYFEETGNWRSIIFLPFNMVWKILVMLSTVINCNFVAYILLYETDPGTLTFTIYYIFEGIYFINTLLSILHRAMKFRKTKSFTPKNAYLLTLDVISLLPYYELYYLLMKISYGENYEFASDTTRVKVFLRLVAVLAFFINSNNEPGLNHLLLMTVLHFVIYSLYCIVFSGIWYDFEEWKTSLTHHYINRESTVNMWLVCYAFVSSIFYHAWSGIITCVTYQEFVLVTVAMLTACVLQIIFYSNLTALFIKQISDQYYFSYRLYVIKNLLDKWKMPLSVKKLVVNFYNTFWEKRLGRSTMPKSFYDRLPASLQKEVSLDTFWDFFRHSHFFNDTDSIFNRNLCLSMKCQYYTAGEFLYTKGELKNRIVYIVSGVIQLLSMDDQNSPVISFSSGTVLGEICCLMCVESSSYLRCATYCEIQVLELKSLAYSMVKYPYISKLLWQKLNARLEIARSLQHEELIKLKSKEEKKTSIRWFKSEWRLIADLAKQGKRTYDGTEIPIVPFHFSKFLNLYVLSDEVELKVKAICLKSEFPCVLDPRNNFKTFCDNLILIVVFIQSVYLPYFIIFKRQLTMHQIGLFYTLDMFYFFALYLDASTAVRTKDRVISNIRDIIIYKGKQITIMIDIFATIPLELFAGMITDSSRATDLLHLNRVLKVYRLVKLVHNAQLNVWLDYTNLRIIKYLLLYTLTIYYLAGFVYSIVCFWECSHIGWYLYNKILKAFLNESSNSKHSSPFISSLHYVISSLLATAWKEFYAYNILDMILEQIVCAIGYYLISFCFAEMSACAVMRLKHQYDFRDRINSLKFFAQRNNLPEELARTMFRATHCHWMYSNGYEVTGQQSVIKHLPPSLKATIVTNRIVNCLKLVPLFRRCNDRTLLELAGISSIEICPPNMIVCRVNSKPTFLHVILNGYCKIESSIPTDKYHEISTTVTRGACFPILEVLMGIDTFLHVASVTYLEVIKIKRKPLLRILEHYCDNYHQLTNILTKHFEDNETVLSRRKGRLPDMVPTLRSQGRGEFFEYKCVDDVDVTEKDINEFNNTFNVIGRWKFIRHVFLRKTFEPTSTFYLRWEIFRCVVAVIQVAYALTLLKLSFIHHIYGYIELVFVVYILVDTYIRMHVRYYNDIGILVTHPLYTALHYFTSSFSVDMFGLFPIYTLQVNTIFGKSRSMNTLLIMTLITRPFLLYKVMRGFSYLQAQAKQGKILFYENCKYLLIVLLVIGMAALALEGFTCSDSDLNDQFTCPNNSWIVNSYYNEAYNAKTPTLVSFFVAFALFSSTSTATYRFLSDRYMWMVCGFSLILFAVKWFVLARITSIWIGGNKNLVQYQHNMNIFLSFCKYHRISNKLIQEAIGHYEYQWEMKKGFDISVIILKKHPVLRSDFYQFMYEKYLRMTDIFHDASQG